MRTWVAKVATIATSRPTRFCPVPAMIVRSSPNRAAATRFGMDMAAVRTVAIHMGSGEPGRLRGVVSRAAAIAAGVSVAAAVALFAFAEPLARTFTTTGSAGAFRAAAVALPFAALVHVYLGATRGLKIMRHTLTVYWVGQPLLWLSLIHI